MKIFDKYSTRGPDYHYRQISRSSFKNYNASVRARFQTLVDNVRGEAKGRALKLLDVGSGDGVALYLLHKEMPELELYGIEPVIDAIKVAAKKVPEAKLSHGTADHLEFENNFFDIVISSDVIEHVEDPDKMLGEIKRVAKDDALIIVGTPIKHSKTPIDHNHAQEWFVEDFHSLLKPYFREIEMYETHNLAFTLLYNAPTKSFINFKYLINLLSLVFRWNPFRAGRKNKIQMFAYMYVKCRK